MHYRVTASYEIKMECEITREITFHIFAMLATVKACGAMNNQNRKS